MKREIIFRGKDRAGWVYGDLILGLQIRRLRDRNGMTQKELAEHLHVSKSVVSSWETYRTEPDIASVVRMAKLFHVTTDYLLTGNQKEIP